jgi:Mycobacterium membrane protein
MIPRVLVLVALLGVASSCVKNYPDISADGGVSPAPTPTPSSHTVEYRVTGTTGSARISYGNAQDGTTDLDTVLPWVAQFRTTKQSIFVFLKATPINFGSLRVQIFVDGSLFREASVDDTFLLDTVEVSGTVDLSTLTFAK